MKENKILISILIPTYNRVKYLEECLDSVVEQQWFNLKELELIVSDNSEWDETKDFMNNYIQKHKNWNINYNKNEKNLWMVWNWNKLLELKSWEYFIFLSDDDKFYDENSLRILYDGLLKYKLDACYWVYNLYKNWINVGKLKEHVNKIKDSGVYVDNFDDQLFVHTIWFWWVLYKDFWYKFYEWANFWADWHMNLQYLYSCKNVGLINKTTFIYREHGMQLSVTSMKWITILRTMFFNYDYFNINPLIRMKLVFLVIVRWVIWRLKSILYDGD